MLSLKFLPRPSKRITLKLRANSIVVWIREYANRRVDTLPDVRLLYVG